MNLTFIMVTGHSDSSPSPSGSYMTLMKVKAVVSGSLYIYKLEIIKVNQALLNKWNKWLAGSDRHERVKRCIRGIRVDVLALFTFYFQRV
jgi:hypothetical protein